MTNQHSITPPPELVEQWYQEYDSFCPRPPLEVYIAPKLPNGAPPKNWQRVVSGYPSIFHILETSPCLKTNSAPPDAQNLQEV